MQNQGYISHYGVKGQKWGVRKRSGDKTRSSPYAHLSNSELQHRIARLSLEQRMRELERVPKNKGAVSTAISSASKTTMTKVAGLGMLVGISAIIAGKAPTRQEIASRIIK